jgi:hypothetical protein
VGEDVFSGLDGPEALALVLEAEILTTVERDYVPGVGMVRSVTISSLGTEMMSREDLVLMAAR